MTTLFCPHFMEPLSLDFRTNFTIPRSFLKYLSDDEIGDENIVTLRDRNLNIWRVQMMGRDPIRFGHGWVKFCMDHNLQVGDFVVFKQTGKLMFDVTMFDPTTYERPLPTLNDGNHEHKVNVSELDRQKGTTSNQYGLLYDDEDQPLEIEFPSFKYEYPHFRYVVKQSNLKNGVIIIPTEFVRKNGLTMRWCDICLKDTKNKSWRMKLRCDRTKADGGSNYYIFCKPRFYEAYGIKEDHVLLFELLSNDKRPDMKFYRKGG